MKNKQSIAIIGGLGHVGLPLGLLFANKNFNVNLIDINIDKKNEILNGKMPFYEIDGEKYLKSALKKNNIFITDKPSEIINCKHIIICIGTPIDEYLNPKTNLFLKSLNNYIKFFSPNQNIIIRSSVYPGICDILFENLKRKKIKNLSYCPERIVQGQAISEINDLPQIISGYSSNGINLSIRLFRNICKHHLVCSVKEAELIKLFSNSWRYVSFAIANQFMTICEDNNISYNELRKKMTFKYNRAKSIPYAGFAAGPCLLKDTMQLNSFAGFNNPIFSAAMTVNEGLPNYFIKMIKKNFGSKIITVGILGMAFKQNIDDIRDSLSFKLKKLLEINKYKVFISDYLIKDFKFNEKELIEKSKVIIIAVPHKKYEKLKIPKNKFVIDTWGITN
jgi:UDP-N-acetyl-D-mannosaminuronic acid dehydrogenase